jgi:hypothetical protein
MSSAINARFRYGIPETRKGTAIYPWANKLDDDGIHPWGTVHGVGVFKDPATRIDYLIIAAAGAVWVTSAHNTARSVPLPGGVVIDGPVSFTQAFDVMVMHRGEALPALEMSSVETGFENIVQTPDGTGTQVIPNATHSLFLQNRLLIPHAHDEIAASDYGNYTRYLPVAQSFKINQGSSDRIVAIEKFNDVTVIVFKDHSIYAVNNVYGDLAALQQDEITDMFGLVARRSVAQVGSDLWFLTPQGVMSLRQTESNKLQSVVLPVSDPIAPLIDRINGRYISQACAAYHDSRYYLAVPLDDAERVGHDLVFQTLYRENESGDEADPGQLIIGGLVAGRTYRWTKGQYDDTLTNGATELSVAGDFVAVGTSVVLTSNIPGPGSGGGGGVTLPGYYLTEVEIRAVLKGINNAVLVYDFLNEAWSGYDQAPGLEIQEWFNFVVNGKTQLFFVSPEGFIKAYEVGVEDALSVPYTDLTVLDPQPSPPFAPGDEIFVNWPGMVPGEPAPPLLLSVTAYTSATPGSTNTANLWFLGNPPTIAAAGSNLFTSSAQEYGFYQENLSGLSWFAPSTLPVQIDGGVRFYSTNGNVPHVPVPDWMLVEQHATAPITVTLVTRGYLDGNFQLSNYQWLELDVQTWNPSFSVSVLHGGPGEVQELATALTKSRTEYYAPFDAPAFDGTNAAGNFATKLRKDYSIVMTGSGTLSEVHFDSGDVTLETHQETRETLSIINARGRAAQIKIVNTNGRLRLLSLRLAGQLVQTVAGTHA